MRALYVAALLLWRLGGAEQARAWAEDALLLAREAGDRRDLAHGLGSMAWLSREWGDYARAAALAEEGLSLYRELGDRRGIADLVLNLGDIGRDRGDPAGVETHCREALATYREQGDSARVAYCLHSLGRAAHMVGDDSRARALCQESLALLRELGDADTIAEVLTSLGLIAHEQGDDGEAARLFTEGLTVLRTGPLLPLRAAHLLEGMAGVAATRREGERAARLLGAADAVRARMGVPVLPANRARYERDVQAARKESGEQRFTAVWNEGRSMSLEEAVAYALGESAEAP
jgi:tetratricopeptide (TPR) repeat protein